MTMLSSLNGKLILAFAVILSALVGYFAVMERYTEGFDPGTATGSFGDCLSAQTGNAESKEIVRDRVNLLRDRLKQDEALLAHLTTVNITQGGGGGGGDEPVMAKVEDETMLAGGSEPTCGDTGAPIRDDVASALAAMREEYFASEKMGAWGRRGVPYLWEKHRLFLEQSIEGTAGQWRVVVRNVVPRAATAPCSCANLAITIWVRFRGQEIQAGIATQDPTGKCEWVYRFPHMARSGKYSVDVKLISVNGEQDFEEKDCDIRQGQMVHRQHIPYRQVESLKFYAPDRSCCEICTRDEECGLWMSPGHNNSKCSLFRGDVTMAETKALGAELDDEGKRLLKEAGIDPMSFAYKSDSVMVGTSRRKPNEEYSTDFIGCGWSFENNMDGPCVINGTDDEPYRAAELLVTHEAAPLASEGDTLPYCDPSGPGIGQGRWAPADPGLNCSYSPRLEQGKKLLFMLASNQAQAEECWIHEQFAKIGENCHESGCRVFSSSIWRSPLIKPKDDELAPESMFRYMWQPYTCRVRLYTKAELRTCMQDKYLYIDGDSIADFFGEYVLHRIQDLNANGAGVNATGCLDRYAANYQKDCVPVKVPNRITADNLHMIHKIWAKNEKEWVAHIEALPEATDKHRRVWLNGPLIVSEREVHVMYERLKRFTDLARPIFERKKWVELNWLNSSAALGYDSATQNDGLHIVGPPMKILFHQLMGHICGG